MYVRHRLDLGVGEILFGLLACVGAGGRGKLARRVLRACRLEEGAMVCLSVRTGWDLYLRALGLAEGDEVLASAITHPDMARIARGHGLVVVPVDLDPGTLAPSVDALEAARTGRTRVVLVAHLFGGRVDLDPIIEFVDRNGLRLVEDCAQAFDGPEEMGHPGAHASLYSFGTLKTATALGGAVVGVKDNDALARMRSMDNAYPVQARRAYVLRLLKAAALLRAGDPRTYAWLLRLGARFGVDVHDALGRAARSFPADGPVDALFAAIRRGPPAPLLAVLARRLERFDDAAFADRVATGDRLSRALDPAISQPGRGAVGRTHWLFPVFIESPDRLVRDLRSRGFDASRATSSIAALRAPDRCPSADAATRTMEGVVFLPAYPSLPGGALDGMAAAVNRLAIRAGDTEEVGA